MFGMFYDEQILQQIIEPTGTMADLLLTLQKFVIEDNRLQCYFGTRVICQNEIYQIHYCSPMEKNIMLKQLLQLFENKEDMPRQDLLYIDTQHNFNIPEYAYVAQCYSKQDLAIQLNAARYILKKNRSIRMIIIDSLHQKSKESKRRTSKTIGEKTSQYDKEVEFVIDELIQSLREFNAIVIVFSQIKYPQNLIKLSQNNQLVVSEKIAGLLENNIYLIPPMFYEQNLYNYVCNIGNVTNTCISVLESKSKIIYSIFDDKNILQTGEA